MVPRLSWEFWDQDSLRELLKPVGTIVRTNQNTLLRLKGKFALVCLNIDITQPFPGSLTLARDGLSMRVPLIYKGLHEVCALCGGESHQLASCPKLPAQNKAQVVVQKFEDGSSCCPSKEPSSENWVTVSLKKRVRPALGPHHQKMSNLKPKDPSPSAKDPTITPSQIVPAPNSSEGIVLANLTNMKNQDADPPNADKLVAKEEGEGEGMEEE